MKTIPQIREELLEVAGELRNLRLSNKIKRLVTQMKRRKAVRRSNRDSAPFTPQLAIRIRNYANSHPHLSYKAIGTTFNVASGRVSEAVAGKRAA